MQVLRLQEQGFVENNADAVLEFLGSGWQLCLPTLQDIFLPIKVPSALFSYLSVGRTH